MIVALKLLAGAAIDPIIAAECVWRTPTAMAHYANDTGLKLPPEWRDLITRRRLARGPTVQLQYPFITTVRGEHAELLAVNALVPRGLRFDIRGDVCQNIMLALWQKTVSMEELQKSTRLVGSFIKTTRRDSVEGGGYALSLDCPMQDGRNWYDVLAVPEHEEQQDDD